MVISMRCPISSPLSVYHAPPNSGKRALSDPSVCPTPLAGAFHGYGVA